MLKIWPRPLGRLPSQSPEGQHTSRCHLQRQKLSCSFMPSVYKLRKLPQSPPTLPPLWAGGTSHILAGSASKSTVRTGMGGALLPRVLWLRGETGHLTTAQVLLEGGWRGHQQGELKRSEHPSSPGWGIQVDTGPCYSPGLPAWALHQPLAFCQSWAHILV